MLTATITILVLAMFGGGHSYAQDGEHIVAAKNMLAATCLTDRYDLILEEASISLKRQMVNNNPDKADQIDQIVDEEAIALAARRGSLEIEAARLITQYYTAEELNDIASFFSRPSGKKFLEVMRLCLEHVEAEGTESDVIAELNKAAKIWANGIRRDLAQNAITRINQITQ